MQELRLRRYGDPFGRSSQGTLDTMQRITLDDIREFFAATYRPNGAILSVAGNIDFPRLRDQVGELFAAWQPAPIPGQEEIPGDGSPGTSPHESNQTHITISYESVPYCTRRLLPGAGGRGRAERRHEFAPVHRSAREARPVLCRVRGLPYACATAGRCSAMPGPPPSGPRRRSTSCSTNCGNCRDGVRPG